MAAKYIAVNGQVYSNNPDSPYIVDVPDIYDSEHSQTLSETLADKVDKVEGKGLSTEDFTTAHSVKLANIQAGAEVNQNAFSKVKVGSTTINSTSKTDTLELVASGNVTLTPDASNKTVTISASGGGGVASVKNLNTNVSSSLSTNSSEGLGGTGTVSLHKVSKTGKYDDLVMDKAYASGSNLGRKRLKKGVSPASQMTDANTIYIIEDDFDIGTVGDGNLTIPANCILQFKGGKFTTSHSGGSVITGNNTAIDADLVKIFGSNITFDGTWNVAEAYPEWFGAGLGNIVGYGEEGVALTNDTAAIQAAVDAFSYVKLSGTYLINTVTVPLYHYVENSTTYTLDGKGFRLMSGSVLKGGVIYVNSSKGYIVENQKVKQKNGNTYQEVAYKDYDNFIINTPAAITIGAESSDTSSRRVTVEDVVIRAGVIVDANENEIAGGTKTTYICSGIKTDFEKIGTKWHTYMMFTDVDLFGLFYGIAGNLRGSKFDVILEQCYDNIDIYGGKNIFNLNGQTGVLLDLNPEGEAIYEFEYFMYLQGAGNVINDGIYDIGSKVRNHKYLIKEDSRNVINSSLKTDYKNALTNLTNGDYRSDLDYTWLGTHKHDYKQDGLQYTATLTEGYHTIKVDGQNVNTNDVSGIDFLNRSNILYLYPDSGQTMSLTLLFEKVKNPFGVSIFAQSNGYNFKNMKVYYSKTTYLTGNTVLVNGDSRVITSSTEIANGSTITVNPGTASEATYTIDGFNVIFNAGNLYVYTLVANVKQGGYPSLDWNAEYNQYREYNQENMRVVLTSDEEVRFYGMCVYTKTSQSLTYGSTANRPVKGLYVGQSYFDTDLSPARPVFWNGAGWSDLISIVELPTHQYIDYFEPDAGVDYHSVSNGTTGVNITVKCYPDGKFESTGTASSSGGRFTKLSEVFELPAGTYTFTREIIKGTEIPSDSSGGTSVDGMMPYLVEDVQGGDDVNVTNFDRARKTITTTEAKNCYIGFNYPGSGNPSNPISYDNSIKLKIATMATFGLDSVIGDILYRLDQLEG